MYLFEDALLKVVNGISYWAQKIYSDTCNCHLWGKLVISAVPPFKRLNALHGHIGPRILGISQQNLQPSADDVTGLFPLNDYKLPSVRRYILSMWQLGSRSRNFSVKIFINQILKHLLVQLWVIIFFKLNSRFDNHHYITWKLLYLENLLILRTRKSPSYFNIDIID